MTVRDETGSLVARLESLRGPLTGYCYRLLGASGEVDDAVQETMLRAFRAIGGYDPKRAALSTWVHRIATNVCLDMLRGAERRALPWDMGPAATGGDLGVPLPPDRWVEPPIGLGPAGADDPAHLAVRHETLRLAFVAALQWLPPRQRAVLVLRDVLGFSAAETAEVVETSVAAANSALQRARATLERHRPRPADPPEPADPAQRDLLRRYVRAFETHDVRGLLDVLADDARSGMPPFPWWLDGPASITAAMSAAMSAGDACAGDRLVPAGVAGGCWTLGQYRPDTDGAMRPFALLVVELRGGRIGDVVTYLGHGDRFAAFGLPALLPDR
ncbi:RNA polymerase subunit sigma-70 [Nonomuraea wenchangensis]|uniref:RNA polymerase sigma-70 factor, ECF subfamily n=1 Tax=Nonomuraea wenchangensis TaxID=568860 RepID=A0A1H9YRH0_9ACTN|nr:RNA polymerase subunit sigma-70 [Nonomuraea wenchangensis]SES71257.1 RNA polymerase sigma-70 factor, ECF subfamily [Nonomuraea wenchangensis]